MSHQGSTNGPATEGDRLRKLWRAYLAECERISSEWAARGYRYPAPARPAFPEELRGLACGAKTRAGTPCKLTGIYGNGRCKLHGGLSTGPKTPEGRAKMADNGRKHKGKT